LDGGVVVRTTVAGEEAPDGESLRQAVARQLADEGAPPSFDVAAVEVAAGGSAIELTLPLDALGSTQDPEQDPTSPEEALRVSVAEWISMALGREATDTEIEFVGPMIGRTFLGLLCKVGAELPELLQRCLSGPATERLCAASSSAAGEETALAGRHPVVPRHPLIRLRVRRDR